ncbi:MAG: hypothetical protein EoVTN8_1223 [Fluviibacter phosphoraccumulans EoVTN8]
MKNLLVWISLISTAALVGSRCRAGRKLCSQYYQQHDFYHLLIYHGTQGCGNLNPAGSS